MASLQKTKKKKGRTKTPSIIPKEEPKPLIAPSVEKQQTSLISVKEADEKHDNSKEDVENQPPTNRGTDSEEQPSGSKPQKPSDAPQETSHPQSPAVTSLQASRPPSGISQRSTKKSNVIEPLNSNIGSAVSLRSKEAWSEDQFGVVRPQTSQSANQALDVNSASSKTSKNQVIPVNLRKEIKYDQVQSLSLPKPDAKDDVVSLMPLGEAEENVSHAYVPYVYARDTVARVMNDMKNMKITHLKIVDDISNNYKSIEDSTQGQFNTFVISLRDQYGTKVKTFRQVIEVHRLEMMQKQQYWDEALASMSNKNKQLLNDKKILLIQNKKDYDRLTKEKEEAVALLTTQLDMAAKDHKEKMHLNEEEKEKMKEHFEHVQTTHEEEFKVVKDNLQTEKEENQRLLEEIEELKNRPIMATPTPLLSSTPAVHDSEHRPPVGMIAAVAMGDEERQKIQEERQVMDNERLAMKSERESFENERQIFLDERKKVNEDKVLMQGDLINAQKDTAVWEAKYNGLKDQLGDFSELQAKYAALQVQMAAVAAMATVSSDEDTKKADEKIERAEQNRVVMEEEKETMEGDLKKWKEEFVQRNGRDPTEDDKPDSIREIEVSLDEADTMINKLNTEIGTLETLKKGEVPQAPTVAPIPITIKDTEVKVVEVKVPDPEVTAQLEMTEEELEALRKQLVVVKNEKSDSDSQNQKLRGEVADATWQLERAETEKNDLEKQRDDLLKGISDGGADTEEVEGLKLKISEKEREVDAIIVTHKEETDALNSQHEKKMRNMEKDMKKMLKEIARLRKEASGEPTERLPDKTAALEDQVIDMEAKISNLETDKAHLSTVNSDLKDRLEKLELSLRDAEGRAASVAVAAAAESTAVNAQKQSEDLKLRIKELEGEIREAEKDLRESQREREQDVGEKDKEIKELENDMKKLIKQVEKHKKKIKELVAGEDGDGDVDAMEKMMNLEAKVSDLEMDREHMNEEKGILEGRVKELEKLLAESEENVVALGAAAEAAVVGGGESDEEELEALRDKNRFLEQAMEDKDKEFVEKEQEMREAEKKFSEKEQQLEEKLREKEKTLAQRDTEMTKMAREVARLKTKLTSEKGEDAAADSAEVEKLEKEVTKLESEVANLKTKLIDAGGAKSSSSKEIDNLKTKLAAAEKAVNKAQSDLKTEKVAHDKTKAELENLRKQLKEMKTTAKTEKSAAIPAAAVASRASKGGAGEKALQEQLRAAKAENKELQNRIKGLELDLKKGGSGGPDLETQKKMKKQEKLIAELEKLLDNEKQKSGKFNEGEKKASSEIKQLERDVKERDNKISDLKRELATLGVAAKEGVESAEKVKELTKDVKKLTEENKTLTENFNSERVLRKKYYNMVEDMKGKIRVYCRVRPMSKTETANGNTNVVKSPDEYTVQVDSSRGMKDFQFDTIFMPEIPQEKVFEDTNNLIQSAVDGYNVCIFAYGQTGSGKTFTIIGDSERKFPGIAPRAFERIYELIEENKSKFTFKVSCYMLELYNDKLLDLFSKGSHSDDSHLDIRKDKKGMVVVQGAEIKNAKNAKELYGLFEEGSKTRHVASTKMNAESSRSHLVIGIVIESTNKTSGTVVKGKLSLVDLAGSERASKTDASAEQLKEAMSINKSLSALGDVISALSSEQQFIPYRNNKLTMLMQDSLGGNAKTLMFVNISPANYNADESVISLTYASRVKLITNDAQKNADNKEINRLKLIINKMKKGETVEEED